MHQIFENKPSSLSHRITILLGAGSVIEIGGPTSQQITDAIVAENFENTLSGEPIKILREIYGTLKSKYPGITSFETIFHIVEMLNAYRGGWTDAKNPDMVPSFSLFVSPENISHFDFSTLSQSHRKIIEIIADHIMQYNDGLSADENEWYFRFWRGYKSRCDFFTLNYDTTIEQSVGDIEDGFEEIDGYDFKKFNPSRLFAHNPDISTISHLHGCLTYGNDRYSHEDLNKDCYDYSFQDLYKWNSIERARDTWFSKSQNSTQAGEQLFIGPIITGLHKLEKLNCYPYGAYHAFLHNKVMQNNRLLIVGYSFGDLYVNQIIERMNLIHGANKRIVVISYFDLSDCEEDFFALSHKLKYYKNFKASRHECVFYAKMMHDDYWNNDIPKDQKVCDPIISKDGTTMLFINGFKDALNRHSGIINEFLK